MEHKIDGNMTRFILILTATVLFAVLLAGIMDSASYPPEHSVLVDDGHVQVTYYYYQWYHPWGWYYHPYPYYYGGSVTHYHVIQHEHVLAPRRSVTRTPTPSIRTPEAPSIRTPVRRIPVSRVPSYSRPIRIRGRR